MLLFAYTIYILAKQIQFGLWKINIQSFWLICWLPPGSHWSLLASLSGQSICIGFYFFLLPIGDVYKWLQNQCGIYHLPQSMNKNRSALWNPIIASFLWGERSDQNTLFLTNKQKVGPFTHTYNQHRTLFLCMCQN